MTAEHERRLLARAHALDDTEDLAGEVTGILGGGRAARVDPDALPGLAVAALALGADSLTVYRAEEARYANDVELAAAIEESDVELAAAIEESDAEITGRAGEAARLRAGAAAALDAAHDALDDARAGLEDAHDALDAARAMPVYRPCEGCHAARRAAIAAAREAIRAAEAHIRDAEERISYAQATVGVLDRLAERLRRALACLRRVIDDLADTYESVYDLRRRGQVMPRDGDWLTGQEQAG